MARRYDSRTTTFSPDGRVFQVEYAMQAVGNAGTCLGILTTEGIVLGSERCRSSKLLDNVFPTDKVYRVSEHMLCGVAGLSADAHVLVLESRMITQRYLMHYGYDIPCEQLVRQVSDVKQQYTQCGGKRPFGTSMLYVGWDEFDGYQLYRSDPSGNYSGWKATCIGKESVACISLLKQDYCESMTLTSALLLATKVLAKSISCTDLQPEAIELVTLVRNGEQTEIAVLGLAQLQALVELYRATEDAVKLIERTKPGIEESVRTDAGIEPDMITTAEDFEKLRTQQESAVVGKPRRKMPGRRKGDRRQLDGGEKSKREPAQGGAFDEKHETVDRREENLDCTGTDLREREEVNGEKQKEENEEQPDTEDQAEQDENNGKSGIGTDEKKLDQADEAESDQVESSKSNENNQAAE